MNNRRVVLLLAFFILMGCQRGQEVQRYTSVVEGKTVDVPALVGGKVIKMAVETGQAVRPGQVIAQVDTTELHWQAVQATAGLREIASQRVTLQVQVQRARADLDYARQRLERTEQLFQENTVPQQTLDDVRNRYQRALSAYRAAREQLNALNARQEQLQAQVRLLRKKLADATIVAPISGVVTTKYVEMGEAIPPLAPVVEITRLDTVWVKIYVSETQLAHITPGNSATVYVDGVNESLNGTIVWVSPQAEFTPKNILTPETRTSLVYAVKVLVPNPGGLLKIGMPVEVAL